MKTPDEIKKGLEYCGNLDCGCAGCPYDDDCSTQGKGETVELDAIAYITQLERRLAQAERERDALMYDFPHGFACHTCKHETTDCNDFPCNDCVEASRGVYWVRWEWRGVCEENSKEENNG